MLADFPPSRAGIISFRYGAVAGHSLGHRFLHARDGLSAARAARLRALLHCLGEILPVSLPSGHELQPGDDLVAPQPERFRDLIGATACGLQRR